jgi:ABC-type multidrug transport system permease subunit
MNHPLLQLALQMQPEDIDNNKFWFANILLVFIIYFSFKYSFIILFIGIFIWGYLLYNCIKWEQLKKRHNIKW